MMNVIPAAGKTHGLDPVAGFLRRGRIRTRVVAATCAPCLVSYATGIGQQCADAIAIVEVQ